MQSIDDVMNQLYMYTTHINLLMTNVSMYLKMIHVQTYCYIFITHVSLINETSIYQ